MAKAITSGQMSVEDYLRSEADGRIRHEYIAGDTFAMTGASARHNQIALRLATAFMNHLRGGPCQTYMSDLKLRIDSGRGMDTSFYYPDLMVACTPPADPYYITDPKLIVEVLSPSTEHVDRREKSVSYCRISSLEEYVMVAQDESEVTVLRRSDEWASAMYRSGMIELRSIGLTLGVEDIYA